MENLNQSIDTAKHNLINALVETGMTTEQALNEINGYRVSGQKLDQDFTLG